MDTVDERLHNTRVMIDFTSTIGIETFPTPLADTYTIDAHAVQLRHFMDGVQRWYERQFGLERVTADPHPLDDPEDIPWRIGRLAAAGPVEQAGLQYIGAFELTETGQISEEALALKGLLVLRKEQLCSDDRHTPTEIVEWDAFGYPGLGRALLRAGMKGVHSEDQVFADVSKPNKHAYRVYEHYGFRLDNRFGPILHGIFNTYHRRFHTNAADLQHRLGLAALEEA
jgi:hypothetical protein